MAAALVRYAAFCIPGCVGTAGAAVLIRPTPESTSELMDATQQHAGLLLQVASEQQVSPQLPYAVQPGQTVALMQMM